MGRAVLVVSDYTDALYERADRRARGFAMSNPANTPDDAVDITDSVPQFPTNALVALAGLDSSVIDTITEKWEAAAPAVRDAPKTATIPEPPKGTVLTFSKSFGHSPGKSFLYAALKVRKDQWSLTGKRRDPMTWAQLLEFIGDGERDGLGWRTIRVATGWEGVE